jgi:hypothetical protein
MQCNRLKRREFINAWTFFAASGLSNFNVTRPSVVNSGRGFSFDHLRASLPRHASELTRGECGGLLGAYAAYTLVQWLI